MFSWISRSSFLAQPPLCPEVGKPVSVSPGQWQVVSPQSLVIFPPLPGDIPRNSDRLPIFFWVVASSNSGTADTVLRHRHHSDTTHYLLSQCLSSLPISWAGDLSLARLKSDDSGFHQSHNANLLFGSCGNLHVMFLCVTVFSQRAADGVDSLPKHGWWSVRHRNRSHVEQ